MKTTAPFVFSAICLAACANGPGEQTVPVVVGPAGPAPSLGGIYSGSFVTTSGQTANISGIIDQDGNARLVVADTNKSILIAPLGRITADSSGAFSATDSEFALNGQSLDSGPNSQTGSVSGTVVERKSITATFLVTGGATATATLNYDAASYEIPSSLSTIAGDYKFDFAGGGQTFTVSIHITDAGELSGSDNSGSGCIYSGAVSVPNALYNAYDVTISNSCLTAVGVGVLSGVADYSPITRFSPEHVNLSVNSASAGGVTILYRCAPAASTASCETELLP